MKILRLLFLSLITVASVTVKSQTCTADVTVTLTGTPGEIQINDNSFSMPVSLSAVSNLYISSTSGGQGTAVPLLPNATSATRILYDGNYNYQLNYYDTIANCSDTFLGSFVISGNPQPPQPTCISWFTHSLNPSNHFEVDFVATGNNNSSATYLWDFGDGTTSSAQNPLHLYVTAGDKIVKLTVSDLVGGGCTNYSVDTIQCGDLCSGQFTYSANSAGNSYIFVPSTSLPGYTYSWDFGDGTSNVINGQQHTSHSYSMGVYSVCLTMSNGSCSSTVCNTINVAHNCNAAFDIKRDSSNLSIQNYIAYNSSYGVNLNYYWDFGDGNFSTQAYPIHVYGSVGTYSVCLSVSDNSGCSSTFCDPLTVVLKSSGEATLNVLEPGQFLVIDSFDKTEVEVYPNPTHDFVRFNGVNSVKGNVTIVDIAGKVLLSKNSIALDEQLINVSSLENGTYIICLKLENQIDNLIMKFVKN